MCSNTVEKRFKCTAHITYEFIVTAESGEEAQNDIFYTIADEIGKGVIPMDVYDSTDCFPIPLLKSVDIAEIDDTNLRKG